MMKQRIFLWLMVLMVMMAFSAVTGYSGTINLPKTGQTACYDSNGNVVACTGTGQDGDTLAGVDWPTARFTVDASGGCVTDNLTGLMWTQNANPAPGRLWQAALTYANNLTLCGFSDWRLPNVNELESLINYGSDDAVAWLNTQNFINVQYGYYWSSTTYFRYSPPTGVYTGDRAWAVNLTRGGALKGGYWDTLGGIFIPVKGSDTFPYVWPVRGGVID